MPTRQPSHSNVSLRGGQPTQRCLEVPQEAIQSGRKRSGTHVTHGPHLVKRSRENLRDEELQASNTQAQLLRIEQQADTEEGPEEVHTIKTLLRELKVKQGRSQNYVKKSIGCTVGGLMSPTVKDGLATLPKLDSKVLEGARLEGELGSLDSIPVETAEERLGRVNDWISTYRQVLQVTPPMAAADPLHRLYARTKLFDDGGLAGDSLVMQWSV